MKKRLICILLIAALLVTVIATTASAAESASANEQEIYSYLTDSMGLSTAAASGILANIYYETGFKADLTVGSYYGLFMYYAPLAAELRSWCAANGYDFTTVNGQMNFFRYKMENTYSSLLSTLKSLSDTADGAYSAGDVFCRQFEKPANTSDEASRRGTLAQNTYFPKYYGTSSGNSSSGSSTSGSSSSSSSAVEYTAYVTASTLNVRSAVGTSSSIISYLTRGSSVSVVAEGADGDGSTWCQLASGGWVSKSYLSTSQSSTASEGTAYAVNASALNVRSGAGLGNDIIGYLASGASVSVVAEDTDSDGSTWCQLASGGWVSKAYLTSGSSASSGTSYTVNASALNIRSGAGLGNSVIGSLYKGSAVTVTATASDDAGTQWGQLASGGWVSMDYLA